MLKEFFYKFQKSTKQQKIFFAATLLIFFSVFFPWFQAEQLQSNLSRISWETITFNGLQKFFIFGMISLFSAGIYFFLLIRELFFEKKILFKYSNEKFIIFLSGENIFSLILALFVFSDLLSENSRSTIKFGIFLSILGHLVIFFNFWSENKKINSKKRNLFGQNLKNSSLQIEIEKPKIQQLDFSKIDE